MIGHKDFPSRSGGVEVMVGGLARSLAVSYTHLSSNQSARHSTQSADKVENCAAFSRIAASVRSTIDVYKRQR